MVAASLASFLRLLPCFAVRADELGSNDAGVRPMAMSLRHQWWALELVSMATMQAEGN